MKSETSSMKGLKKKIRKIFPGASCFETEKGKNRIQFRALTTQLGADMVWFFHLSQLATLLGTSRLYVTCVADTEYEAVPQFHVVIVAERVTNPALQA